MTEKNVLPGSPEAAQYRTDIKGWVSRHGRFFGDGDRGERLARIDGCTHTLCKRCGALNQYKHWSICTTCREQNDIARYEAMPRADWDGEAPLYSEAMGEYYGDLDEALDSIYEDGGDLADLRLTICEPLFVTQLDPGDFADQMPEDSEVPDELIEAIGEFNEAVKDIQLSWRPGNTALRLEGEGSEES